MNLGPFELGPTHHRRQGVYVGDSKILCNYIPDNSIDLIFTDPIYSNIHDYEWLAQTAARILKPGKSCLALAGNMEKPIIYQLMSQYLTYHWEAAIMYKGPNFFMNSKCIQVSWKPILWFTKGKREPKWCKDALTDSGVHKLYHRFQQSPTPALWFIRQLTPQYDTILDPFSGFGTYPIAAKMLNRHYLGIELIPSRARIARKTLSSTSIYPQPELVPYRQLDLL